MDKLLRPASILLYIIAFIDFFFIGATVAGVSGAADVQGLSGGAVVLMYGVIASFIALVLAIVLAYYLSKDTIKNITKVLALILLGYLIFFIYKSKMIEVVAAQDIENIV
jgi:hypothetical protein